MRASGGCAAQRHCYSARRHLGDGGGLALAPAALPASPSSPPSHRARLERALCATTAVLFVASVSYVALSTLAACYRAARARRPPTRQPGAAEPQAVETKRALDEIPVVEVRVRREGGAEDDEEACAVCLAEYASGEQVRVLPACRHGFHRQCVDRWLLTRAPTCPVCRAPIAASTEERDATRGCGTADAAVLPSL